MCVCGARLNEARRGGPGFIDFDGIVDVDVDGGEVNMSGN